MTVTVLIGNGLSCGFDGRLATRDLTDRVLSRLGSEFTDALAGLAELASPDDVDRPLGVDRGNFEQLAGPVDRIAEAMTASEAGELTRLDGKPLIVLTAEQGNAPGWMPHQDAMAALSTNSLHNVVPGATISRSSTTRPTPPSSAKRSSTSSRPYGPERHSRLSDGRDVRDRSQRSPGS